MKAGLLTIAAVILMGCGTQARRSQLAAFAPNTTPVLSCLDENGQHFALGRQTLNSKRGLVLRFRLVGVGLDEVGLAGPAPMEEGSGVYKNDRVSLQLHHDDTGRILGNLTGMEGAQANLECWPTQPIKNSLTTTKVGAAVEPALALTDNVAISNYLQNIAAEHESEPIETSSPAACYFTGRLHDAAVCRLFYTAGERWNGEVDARFKVADGQLVSLEETAFDGSN